ncbi:helix-turn-helix domain-containing protein [Paraburkholderia pallida]|uniref:AraC family transcriptional regulator n=1 Tax=Paraburkholderia pallida TaxID=2547399 RepID=A0A4P7DCD9_9BURK|nr:AraC family transcriptional regulator [Paraburkholderia pallida]QBR04372.1 AraC family transcriptional regulator [Paraburkholderia pallida]
MHPIIESVSQAWNIAPLSVLPVEHEVTGARWLCAAGKHRKPFTSPPLEDVHVVSLVLRAFNVQCWVDGEIFHRGRVQANRLRIVPAGHSPSWVADSVVEMFHIYIPDAVLRRRLSVLGYCSDMGSSLLRATSYVSDPLLQNLMQRLAVTVRAEGRLQEQYLGTLSDALLLHLLSYYNARELGSLESRDPRQLAIEAAIDDIAGSLATHTDNQTLANNADMSVSQFTRNFQKATGLTPHQYRLRLRIEVAKEKLKGGMESFAAIADELGFADQAHFTRAFRQFAGVTPGEFSAAFKHSTAQT